MIRRHLLPSSATARERAVSEALDRIPELALGSDAVHGFKFDPPAAVIPHLIVEYGLGEIEPYVGDYARVLEEGIAWQRIRGTPAALHMALRWIESDGVLEENPATRFKWWWFQIHLPDPRRSSDFVTPMIGVTKASKPLRSEFARVTAGYDVRGFLLNGSRLNAALLNSWSGVRRAPGEPVLSIRWRHRVLDADGELYGGLSGVAGMAVHHAIRVSAAAPVEQRSGFPATSGASVTDYSDPAGVPFSNAPFSDEAFGVPIPQVQTGF